MNAPLLASMLSRCLSLWLLWLAYGMGTQTVSLYFMPTAERGWIAWSAATTAAVLVAAVWTWVEAPAAARLLLRGLPQEEAAEPLDRESVERLIFTGIGVLVLADAVPSIAQWGVRLYLLTGERFSAAAPVQRPIEIANIVGDLARIAVGLLLVLRVDGIRRGIASLRPLKREESA